MKKKIVGETFIGEKRFGHTYQTGQIGRHIKLRQRIRSCRRSVVCQSAKYEFASSNTRRRLRLTRVLYGN
jgi:hypothetical protein